MRIAVVCPYDLDQWGGVQVHCRELVDHLDRDGHDAWLVGPGRAGPTSARLVGATVGIPANRSIVPISIDPRSARRTLSAVADADVVHIHEPLTPVVALAALLGRTPQKVGTFHADSAPATRRLLRLSRSAAGRVLGRLAGSTAVSEAAASVVEPLGVSPTIVPNGVDTAGFASAGPRSAHRVVFIGRDEPRKGLDVLLAAWPAVRAAVPDAELTVLSASRPSAPAGVTYLGPVDEARKRRELGSASVFCAPNLGGESFGIVVVEGMAAGCAVVASAIPAFGRLVGESGILVPPGRPDQLARALVDVLTDDERRSALSAAAERRATEYDWEVVLPAYLDVYRRARSGQGRR